MVQGRRWGNAPQGVPPGRGAGAPASRPVCLIVHYLVYSAGISSAGTSMPISVR